MSLDILCAGGVICDLIARPLLRPPAHGELQLVERIDVHLGGSAANTGAHLAHMGFRVGLASVVGDDALGGVVRNLLAANGVDARWLAARGDTTSAATQVTVDGEGERTFVHAVGALRFLAAEHIPLRQARELGARIFHLAGYFGLPALEGEDGAPAAALFRQARELGYVTSLDGMWDATGRWVRLIGPVLPHVDIFCPSLNEAQRITGRDDPEGIIDRLLELGVRRLVALTMGPRGAHVGTREGARASLPPARVATVDSTGAGDAFVAGMLAGALRGDSVIAASCLAGAAGALATTAVGGANGIASLAQAQSLAAEIRVAMSVPAGLDAPIIDLGGKAA